MCVFHFPWSINLYSATINISQLPTSQTQNGSSNSSKNFMSTLLFCAIFLNKIEIVYKISNIRVQKRFFKISRTVSCLGRREYQMDWGF